MTREGTRSQTGHSRPRIFPPVDTAPATTRKRTTKPKAKKKAAVATKGAKPAGVTKKKAPAKKKETGVVKKVRWTRDASSRCLTCLSARAVELVASMHAAAPL
jgi:hypothetical protein